MAFKMPNIGGLFERAAKVEVSGIPVGHALLLTPALGIMEAINVALKALVPEEQQKTLKVGPIDGLPLVTSGAVAFALTRIKQVRQFFGDSATNAFVLGTLVSGVDNSADVTQRSRYYVARLADLLGSKEPWKIANMASEHYGNLKEGTSSFLGDVPVLTMSSGRGAPDELAGLVGTRPDLPAVTTPSPNPADYEFAGALGESSITDVNRVIGSIRMPGS